MLGEIYHLPDILLLKALIPLLHSAKLLRRYLRECGTAEMENQVSELGSSYLHLTIE